MLNSIVVVGAGQAGQQLVASLRQSGYSGLLTLLGAEAHAPYQRPPLSKGLLSGQITREELGLAEEGFYERHSVDLRLSTTVSAIDRQAKAVITADGQRIAYDQLVLATGTRNRQLPPITASSTRILQLRSQDDAQELIEGTASAKNIVIIGGGFIGLELAASLRQEGRKITIFETMGRLLDRAISPVLSKEVRRHHESHGVSFHFNRRVAEIIDLGKQGFRILLDNATSLSADAVISAIGVQPNSEIAKAAGLDTENGIQVNGRLRCPLEPSIAAIGDCCAFPNGGQSLRLESVNNAVSQANYLAQELLNPGSGAAYREIPTFWSDQGGLLLQIVGLSARSDQSVMRGDPENKAFSIFRFRDAELVAVESFNRGGDHMVGRRLLSMGISPSPDDIADLSFDLRSLLVVPA